MADIFVSYTSNDRDWAFWIGQELEKLGHAPRIHEWEISAGGDIAKWMDERLKRADSVLCVVSAVYLTKDYSGWERRAAQWAAQNRRPNFALPVFVEDCEPSPLLAVVKRCDLYGVDEEEARARLAAYLTPAAKPTGAMRFPGKVEVVAAYAPTRTAVAFPGGPSARQPRNLPFASLGDLFKGRETELESLRAALVDAKGVAVAGRTLHGLGGIGKTRLAIEYALRHEVDYSALLFVRADSPATLNASLVALASAAALDLAEKEAKEDTARIEAALRWLADHPTWLMILDNVDDGEAVRAVAKLMARLRGGHVIVTARAADFPASLRKIELGVLDEAPATEFLLERTQEDRVQAPDDAARARELAQELGGLALGLEQAGAYINKQRIPFARYLKLWSENRDKALAWSDAAMTGLEKTLATTWVTSVGQLPPESRRLLDRLAFFAPDPIPDSLIDVSVPGEATDYDGYEARAGLYSYSLATHAKGEDGARRGFVVHRLVQDFARRAMTNERRAEALREALGWVNAAFVGDVQDVRSWPVLDPLAPHALAIARRADEAKIAEPTRRLLNQLALLTRAKARYAEAEPLMRRALEISEASLGPKHPEVANQLNNLAGLLYDTNRLAEAEMLYRRVLKIDEASLASDDPKVAIHLSNLAAVHRAANRFVAAERLMRRALRISKESLGPEHPDVAIRLNNLAEVLRSTNRFAEAEPLYRRALEIWEISYGPDHPQAASILNNIATLLRARNRHDESESLHRRALAIREKSYGPDHPDVAESLNNLALVFQATNRFAEAEALFSRAFAICQERFGADHPRTVTARKNLAALLAALSKGGSATSSRLPAKPRGKRLRR